MKEQQTLKHGSVPPEQYSDTSNQDQVPHIPLQDNQELGNACF